MWGYDNGPVCNDWLDEFPFTLLDHTPSTEVVPKLTT